MMKPMQIAPQLAIDLGSKRIRAAGSGSQDIFSCPAQLVREVVSGEVVAIGEEAADYSVQSGQELIFPIRSGEIVDYHGAVSLLDHALDNTLSWWHVLKPQVVISESCTASPAVSQLTGEALQAAGGGSVFLVSVPTLAALGAGVDPTDSAANLVVDIGAGTTEVGVIARGSSVTESAIPVGGNQVITAIVEYVNETHNVSLPEAVAEKILKNIGTAVQRDSDRSYTCYAPQKDEKDTREITISANRITNAVTKPLQQIINVVSDVIKDTPTTLLSDIAENGIYITGGMANTDHMDTFLERRLSLPVTVADSPEEAVIRGARDALDYISVYKQSVPKG